MFTGKQKSLYEAVIAHREDPSAENLFELMRVTNHVLQPDAGLVWDEVMDVVEEVTGGDLSHMRPPKCKECGEVLNRNGHCLSATCDNSMWKKGNK